MIVSHKYRFIFIKTLKTAGTSVEVFLSNLCDQNDIVTPVLPPEASHFPRNHRGLWNPIHDLVENKGHRVERTAKDLLRRNKFYNHIPAKLLRHRLPSTIWNSYFKFCIERNPWDKTLSHFYMVKERMGGALTFEEYLDRGSFCYNYPVYLDNDDNILVDKVVKYESLNEDLAEVFSGLGVPYEGTLGIKAKSGHRRDRRSYQEVYSPESRDIIANAFEKEILLHGYSY